MKTKLQRFVHAVWQVLSEVPGWPDAPRSVRMRRVLPVLVPCALAVALGSWKITAVDARLRTQRAEHAPLLVLEQEVADLRLGCSDQQAAELAHKAIEAGAKLLPSADDAPAYLKPLATDLRGLGWEAQFQAFASTDGGDEPGLVAFAPVRARLAPLPGNDAPFGSLLAAFDKLSAAGKRIELTRVVIRADDEGKPSVEAHLRIAARPPHEKIPE